jgi:hypothetical protein
VAFSEYSKPPIAVQAEQIEDEPRSIITPNGAVTAQPGDWEVRFPDGNVQKMTDEEFQEDFGDKGSEESGNKADAPAIVGNEEKDTDGMGDEESALEDDDNGTQDESDTTKDAEEERPGDKAETESATRRPSPPPTAPRRR